MADRTTILIARVIGPVLLVTSTALLVRLEAMRDAIRIIFDSPAFLLTLGFISLISGLVILAVHFRWRGVKEISVTLIGAALTLRGVVLLTFPEILDALASPLIGQTLFYYVASAASIALGAWFTFIGIQKSDSAGQDHEQAA